MTNITFCCFLIYSHLRKLTQPHRRTHRIIALLRSHAAIKSHLCVFSHCLGWFWCLTTIIIFLVMLNWFISNCHLGKFANILWRSWCETSIILLLIIWIISYCHLSKFTNSLGRLRDYRSFLALITYICLIC